MQTVACPPTEQLKAYLSGKLDESASDVLAQHLLDCQVCERTAVELEQEPDTLVELLQEDMSAGDPSQPPATHEVAANSDFLQFPQVLGQYELRTRLGTGGMGAVYLGRHKSLDKQVAVKLLPVLPAQNTEFVARFQREMRAAGKLDHPAIVRTTDAGERQGIHYLVMDAIDGMDLGRLVRVEDKLSVADACEMARQAAVGLAHAHEKGIVHRDVKPSNLMLDASGQIRILDFGLAQIGFWESGSAEITTVGQLMGTLDYMAPEQAERGGAVDYRADLYSLGATLFRLLTGRAPLAAAPNLTPLEKLRLLATHRPPKLRSLRPDVPEALSEIVDAMLAREPSQRPASASHAAELLEPFGTESDLSSLLQRARSKPVVDEPSFVLNPLLQRDLAEWRTGNADTPSDVAMKDTRPAQLIASESTENGSQRSNRWNRWTTWVVAAGFFAMLWGGIVLVLETSKGQLVIDSEADVQVKIVAIDEGGQRAEVDQLQIEPGTQATRLKSGKYEITIDAGSDSIGVTNGSFTIQRGQTVVATITQKPSTTAQAAIPTVPSIVESEDPRLNQIVFGNETLDTWLRKLEFERSPPEIARALTAIQQLASDDLQDVIRAPLVRFAQRTKNGEFHGQAIAALKECCGETLHEAVGEILSNIDDEEIRNAALSQSIVYVVDNGISQIGADSLFMTEALRLLDSPSPEASVYAASLLRGLLWEFPEGQSNQELQQSLLDKFTTNAALTDENFWLPYPGSDHTLKVLYFRDGDPRHRTAARPSSAVMLNAIVDRSVSALVESTTPVKVKAQASIVLRSLLEEKVGLAASHRERIEVALAQEIARAAENLSLCELVVELPESFQAYVAPTLPITISRSRSSGNTVNANALIQTMNLAMAIGLNNGLNGELQALLDTLHASPLFNPALAAYLRDTKGRTWSALLEQYSRQEPSYLPRRAIYLQAGTMLGKSQDELLARFELKLPADIDWEIERQLDEIQKTPYSLRRSAIDDLHQLPIQNNAKAVRVLESLFSDAEFFNQHGRRQTEQQVWMKAASEDFPASYARVLGNTAGEHRLGLLNSDLTVFPEFQCTKPDALTQLLDWCEQTIQADTEQTYQAAITGMLSRLVTDKPCNSVECQRMVVERLESFAFLSDQVFWLARPLQVQEKRASIEPWGPPMRQAILKRAFAHIAKNSDTDDALLCQALAIVRQGLEDWNEVPEPMRLDAIEQMQQRLVAAAEKPDSQAKLHLLPFSFFELTYPTLVDVRPTLEEAPKKNANTVILILNLLTTARELNSPSLNRLSPTVQALHESIEQLNLRDPQLSRWGNPQLSKWGGSRWDQIVSDSQPPRDRLLHTWYMQTGGLLGHDMNTLRERPAKLYEEDRERKRRFIQPRDTLAIHIPGLLPQSGDPPVLQAGKSTPVVGFPVPVSSDGTIQLPLLEPIRVAELDLAQVQAEIDAHYVGKKLLSSDSPRGISVQFLLRADQGLEIRNVSGNASVTIPEK